jgi:hypothetical protein
MSAAVGIAALGALGGFAIAQPVAPRFDSQIERRVALDEVLIETVRIETTLQGWTMRKVCLDGQAYWLGFTDAVPTGIAPVYKDGRPEQCGRRSK